MRLPECGNDPEFVYSQVLGHYNNNLMRGFYPVWIVFEVEACWAVEIHCNVKVSAI